MDPNEALNEIRRLIDNCLDSSVPTKPAPKEAFLELAELVSGLDDWISGGGFLPEAWKPPAPEPLATRHTHPKPWVAVERGLCPRCDAEADLAGSR